MVFAGAEVSAHFDSMLVKLTCRGRDLQSAARRAFRALTEFRIRGVSTNIPFLEAVITDPDFLAGHATTSFIDERPHLLHHHLPADRGTKLLKYLAGVSVNKPHGEPRTTLVARTKLPALDRAALAAPPASGSKQQLIELGRNSSPRRCALSPRSPSPTPPSATRTSRCWRPGCAPATCCTWRRTSPGCCPGCSRWSPGAGPPTTSPCAS